MELDVVDYSPNPFSEQVIFSNPNPKTATVTTASSCSILGPVVSLPGQKDITLASTPSPSTRLRSTARPCLLLPSTFSLHAHLRSSILHLPLTFVSPRTLFPALDLLRKQLLNLIYRLNTPDLV